MLRAAAEGKLDLLVLLGADPLNDCPDVDLARRALAGARRVLSIDTFLTDSNANADAVLAAAAYGEKSGTTTNLEGRVTTVAQKITPDGTVRPDWMIAAELAIELGHDLGFGSVAEVTDAIAATVPAFAGITTAALATQRDGIVTAITPATLPDVSASARERNTYDYRLAVSRKLYDNAVGTLRSPSLSIAGARRRGPRASPRLRPDGSRGRCRRSRRQRPRLGDPPARRQPVRAARHGLGSVQPARRRHPRGHGLDRARHRRSDRAAVRPGALLGADPLLDGDLLWTPLLIVLMKVVIVFVLALVGTMLMVWFERKVIAGMQNRVGPNKAGPFGILQTLADGIKLFFKEDLLPERADKWVFRLAPLLAVVPAFLVWSVIPLGGDFSDGNDGLVTWFGHETRVQLADPPIGILFVLALSSIAVYGIMLAGWSSGSKYPLLGAVRSTAQMISYEAALGLSLAAVLLFAGTLSTSGIVAAQDRLVDWHIVATGFVPFFVFMIAATAELNRPPFDLVEAEQELVGGFNTEYSSIRFALFFLAEFMNTITMSAIIVTLFLGGPQPVKIGDTTLDIPLIGNAWEGTVWLMLKVLVFLYVYVWFRATLPRLRYDQLMDFGWKVLIPVALGWYVVLAAINLGRDRDWSLWMVVPIALIAMGTGYLVFSAALKVSARNRAQQEVMY